MISVKRKTILLFLIILDLFKIFGMSSSSQSNSFLRSSEDLKFLTENLPVGYYKDFGVNSGLRVHNISEDTLFPLKNYLKFHPPVLDFKERSLGTPHHEKVIVINSSSNKTIHLASISGNTFHFHSSFFQDELIHPLCNTSFNVVFLGRGEGEIESNLFIHTSEGSFKYQVKGTSVESPYRIRPLLGIRLPLNASFYPLILIHNPHDTPLQLTEVFCSCGDFHLELPSGEFEGSKHIWRIPAYLTKPIIRLKYHATSQLNHTAYIRLKIDRSGEILVIPVEIEVGSTYGLYSTDNVIDFGIGGSEDPPKKMNLYLHNTRKQSIQIKAITSIPTSKALKVDLLSLRVPSLGEQPTQAAELTLNWKLASETGISSGKLIIKSHIGEELLILGYIAKVLPGGLIFNKTDAMFRSDQPILSPRAISLTNKYKIPVVITNASLSTIAAGFFQIIEFTPTLIMPGETVLILKLAIKGTNLPVCLVLESALEIFNNVSTLHIPLHFYDGKLKKVIPSDTNNEELNLGTVGSGSTNSAYFALLNKNPIPLHLLFWGANITGGALDVVAVERGNISEAVLGASVPLSFSSTNKVHLVHPDHYSIFHLTVAAGLEIGFVHGWAWVSTKFETIYIKVNMRVEHGSLKVINDPVIFHNCSPSAVCSAEVRVESQFSVGMAVTGISSVPHHAKLGFVPVSSPIIPPGGRSTLLGHITWDISGLDPYISTNSINTGTYPWLDTLELPSHVHDLDLSLFTNRYDQYLRISNHLINLSLRLDTTEVRNIGFQAQIRPVWPFISQVPSRSISFPLTQVGKSSYKCLTISNPATKYSIIVQLVLESSYPSAEGLVNELPKNLRPSTCIVCNESIGKNGDVFFVSVKSDGTVSNLESHKRTIAFLLTPSSKVSVTIEFRPRSAEYISSILIIRNNLTVLEIIQLSGTGAYTQFKFGNRKPGSVSPLLFELAEKHLKDCEREISKSMSPNITVKRSFTARNTGAIPLVILGFSINGLICEGFGFRILNCHSFYLPVNSSRKIDIAFTPDFTLSRISRILTIHTSNANANYILVATLSPYSLLKCSSALSRPTWEPLLYYSAISFMIFLLACVISAAFFESNRILQNAITSLLCENNVQPVLDLRLVGNDEQITCPGDGFLYMQAGVQSKSLWNLNQQNECQILRDSSKSFNHSLATLGTITGNSKVSGGNMSIGNGKRRCDHSLYKRPFDITENNKDRSKWECTYDRIDNSIDLKANVKTSICITTEPYSPLANIKSAEINTQNSKADIHLKSRVAPIHDPFDQQPKKSRKKFSSSDIHYEVRKESIETCQLQNSLEEAETSSTSTDSSSNENGDLEIHSMFFNSVRHHLQNKVKGNQFIKTNEPPQQNYLFKKPLMEKGSSSSVDNEWDVEEDHSIDQGIFVKNYQNKHTNLSGKSHKRNSKNRLRFEHTPQRLKQCGLERNLKPLLRKEKTSIVKKQIDKCERQDTVNTGTILTNSQEVSASLPLPGSVWATSFSDVVSRSESSYSSVVSLKGQHVQQEYYKQAPIGANKALLNNVWSNWMSYSKPVSNGSPTQNSSTNSLFTDSASNLQGCKFDSAWTEENITMDVPNSVIDSQLISSELPFPTENCQDWPLMTSSWKPLYTPSVGSSPPVWGSEVWAPFSQQSQSSSSSSPPLQGSIMVQHNMDYDPFRSLSNIWERHSPNIWKPPNSD